MQKENPKVRDDLEIVPGSVQGQQIFVVRDTLGLIESPVVLNRVAAGLLAMLDGTQTSQDIALALVRRGGDLFVKRNEIEKICEQFDAAFLLDSWHYREARQTIVAEFSTQTVREPSLAGQSYPRESKGLRERLNAILALESENGAPLAGKIIGLVAPHIDLNVGQTTYAAAYRRIRGMQPDLVIILGTGHVMEDHVFCVSRKDFRTPLGIVKTDRQVVHDLHVAGENSIADNDMPHRREHSIEFQLIFLQHVLNGHPFQIVPVLCGSIARYAKEFSRPGHIPGVKEAISVLRRVVDDKNRNVLVVAGVDLSHIGPKFGDDKTAQTIAPFAKSHDQALLKALCKQDVVAFCEETKRVQDRFHVCGFSSLACMMEMLPPYNGHVHRYDTWHEEATMSAVSFAALEFTKKEKR